MSRRGTVLLLSLALCAGACGGKKLKSVPPGEAFRRAEALMEAGKHAKAIGAFQEINTAGDEELRALVHLRVADGFYERGNILNLAEAQSRYLSFLNFFPLSDQAPYAQYRYGMCLKRQINGPERDQTPTLRAVTEFRKVQELYPNSSWVDEAQERIRELDNHLSEDALRKARFYYRRKAFKAAAGRLKAILEANPDFQRRDEVLFYLGMSLRRQGEPAAGAQVLQSLLDELPDSKYAARARKKMESAPVDPGSEAL